MDSTRSENDDLEARERSPLQDVVLCCTSIAAETRSLLAEHALELGAIHRLDLTSDVTHLLIGTIDTPKYRYVAKERPDIKVLMPGWLEAVRKEWLTGDIVDIGALEEAWRAPALLNLHISVTGFDDVQQRQEMQRAINANGGQYHGDLTRTITHLIAKEAKGKKFEFASQWGTKIVTIEWLEQSLQRGMALDEQYFSIHMNPTERGKYAVNDTLTTNPSSVLGKRQRKAVARVETGPRRIRRTASTRLEGHHGDIWAGLGSSVLTRTDSRQEITPAKDEPDDAANDVTQPSADQDAASQTMTNAAGLFHGQRFFVTHFDERKTPLMKTVLASHGGNILAMSDLEERASRNDFFRAATGSVTEHSITVIQPHDIHNHYNIADDLRQRGLVGPMDHFNTEWWVEKSMHQKRLADHEGPLCKGFSHPLPGFDGLLVCPSSFEGIDLLHFKKTVELLGARYDETLRPTTSVMVCSHNSMRTNADKLRYAVARSIPIVTADWLFACMASNTIEAFAKYAPTSLIASFRVAADAQDVNFERFQPQRASDNTPRRPVPSSSSTAPFARPLAEISPNSSKSFSRAGTAPSRAEESFKVPAHDPQLKGALARLLAGRKDRTAGSGHERMTPTAAGRPLRKLGRASSNPSSLSSLAADDKCSQSKPELAVDPPIDVKFQPSQTLSYEDPEAAATREKLLLKMGIGLVDEDDGRERVEKIGVVRNVFNASSRRRSRRNQ